ncbi:MAG: bioF [Nevskia sp.]|nr:bioF [Nevskia sp.]
MSAAFEARLSAELARLRQANLYRTRRVVEGAHGILLKVDGRCCINFCSNDYLGLAADPRVAEAARQALAQGGTGSGASALISGYNLEHARLEEELADFLGRPRALLFSTGWAANLGVLRGLLGKRDVLLADELNHASLIDGGRLSGAEYRRVAHADLPAFAAALEQAGSAHGTKFVVSDAVFSMDGDCADLPALAALSRAHEATLMIDDAHGFGVLGPDGRGSVAAADLDVDDVPIYVATLGKSLGAAGAFVAGSEALIETLIQRARSWVFSTAPPPAIAAAARAALRIVRSEPERRQQLFANIAQLRAGAAMRGIAIGLDGAAAATPTPILPLILGDEARAIALSRYLFERGLWVAAIRPPTVPAGTARLRITLSATHTRAQIEDLLDAIAAGLATLDAQPVAAVRQAALQAEASIAGI